ncbi:hypothetical protein M378DRAFT_528911 [Amanita muscaria Koide BX008]|uniref:Uncharacterized protein n=1 Tax=Amanita muscaria (strain Koide BX008) TaxID=946122 RepID=A0A0C2X814_AMAMK|nr:hypothetical protein M378DRAFT_528911 [Amanita muscaria Koide BX008]
MQRSHPVSIFSQEDATRKRNTFGPLVTLLLRFWSLALVIDPSLCFHAEREISMSDFTINFEKNLSGSVKLTKEQKEQTPHTRSPTRR